MEETILTALIDFFQADGWTVTQADDAPILQLEFEGDNGAWTCYAEAWEEPEQVAFYSVCPVSVPERQRSAVGELVCRANAGLVIGNFELDFDDGEIRYKTSLDLQGVALNPTVIARLVYGNVMTLDEYLPAFSAVLDDEISPVEALARIEAEA